MIQLDIMNSMVTYISIVDYLAKPLIEKFKDLVEVESVCKPMTWNDIPPNGADNENIFKRHMTKSLVSLMDLAMQK